MWKSYIYDLCWIWLGLKELFLVLLRISRSFEHICIDGSSWNLSDNIPHKCNLSAWLFSLYILTFQSLVMAMLSRTNLQQRWTSSPLLPAHQPAQTLLLLNGLIVMMPPNSIKLSMKCPHRLVANQIIFFNMHPYDWVVKINGVSMKWASPFLISHHYVGNILTTQFFHELYILSLLAIKCPCFVISEWFVSCLFMTDIPLFCFISEPRF